MTDLESFLARHPELREVDIESLRKALRDRVIFDQLMSGPPPVLSDEEQRRVAAIQERLLAHCVSSSAAESVLDRIKSFVMDLGELVQRKLDNAARFAMGELRVATLKPAHLGSLGDKAATDRQVLVRLMGFDRGAVPAAGDEAWIEHEVPALAWTWEADKLMASFAFSDLGCTRLPKGTTVIAAVVKDVPSPAKKAYRSEVQVDSAGTACQLKFTIDREATYIPAKHWELTFLSPDTARLLAPDA